MAVCDNSSIIRRCRLHLLKEHGEAFRGHIPSKRRYFYGLRVHLVVSGAGEPVGFALAAGSEADEGAQGLEPGLARRFDRFGKKAFTGYDYEVLFILFKEVGLHPKARARRTPSGRC